MSVLTERPEIIPFITSGQSKPPEQFVEELASFSLETKRIPDPYYFEINPNNELFSPSAYCRVKDAVEDKTGFLGRSEYQAVLSIEQWVTENSEGAAVWVSPPSPGFYPTTKIIISEIEYQNGFKRLFNRAIILDFDRRECQEFAEGLAKFSQNRPLITHLEQIRSTPFFLSTRGNAWVYVLQELIDDPALWQSIRNGDDRRAKKEAIRQATVVQKQFFIASADVFPPEKVGMAIMQMLGEKSGSCPPKVGQGGTAFQVFAGSSLLIGVSGGFTESDHYGSLEFQCPHADCGKTNRRSRGRLIPNCQHCGKDVRC